MDVYIGGAYRYGHISDATKAQEGGECKKKDAKELHGCPLEISQSGRNFMCTRTESSSRYPFLIPWFFDLSFLSLGLVDIGVSLRYDGR